MDRNLDARLVLDSVKRDLLGRDAGPVLVGRYRLESWLARGGSAAVYKVFDPERGVPMAMKLFEPRARVGDAAAATAEPREPARSQLAFQHEYYTLAALRHPRIIQVYDYGISPKGPFYTMELLDGDDLRQLAPLPWRQACGLLRDVASSLAILHSRRWVHRDVSPGNIRCTGDGRAKLLDFGAMVSMGVPRDVVGTPPYMSPETVVAQPLDGRADLYSLGAVAYRLLAATDAFPARHTRELRSLWQRSPVPLRRLAADLPEALEELVMALLSLRPAGRPGSAAEVSERLSAIAGLEPDEDLREQRAYLNNPVLVGREGITLDARKQLVRGLRGRGGSFIVRGVEGSGRTRLLAEITLEARLLGMTVARADGLDARDGAYGVHRALASGAEAMVADLPACPGPTAEGGDTDDDAIHDWWMTLARRRPVLLVVDDMQTIEPQSAAVLARLATAAPSAPLVLVFSLRREANEPTPALAEALSERSTEFELAPLNVDQASRLLGSIFGHAPNVEPLANYLHGLSGGLPGELMRLAEYLVATGWVQYSAGAWTLPDRIETSVLPGSFEQALARQVEALSEPARVLAQSLALGPEAFFSQEELISLSDAKDLAELFRLLDELLAAGILVQEGEHFLPSQQAWVEALRASLDDEGRQRAHRRLAELFNARPWLGARESARHLYAAGDKEAAVDRMLVHTDAHLEQRMRYNPKGIPVRAKLPTGRFPAAGPAYLEVLEACLQLAIEQGRPEPQRCSLRLTLALHSTHDDPACMARHLEALFEQLSFDAGLTELQNLGPALPLQDRLQQALGAAQRRAGAGEARSGFGPAEAIPLLAAVISSVPGAASTCRDVGMLDVCPSLTPYYQLSAGLQLADLLVRACSDAIAGRRWSGADDYTQALERLGQPEASKLDTVTYHFVRLSCVFATASAFAFRADARALEGAAELDNSISFKVLAWLVRRWYHAMVGDHEEAEACKKRVESLRVRHVANQWFEQTVGAFYDLVVCGYTDDLMGVKRAIEPMRSLAQRFVHWRPVPLFGQAEYERIRGNLPAALAALEQALEACEPGRDAVWPLAAARKVLILTLLGRAAEAFDYGLYVQQVSSEHALSVRAGELELPLALAQAKVGQLEEAAHACDARIATCEREGLGGLLLGTAHETRAYVALWAGDAVTAQQHAELCGEHVRAGHNPPMTARHQRLLLELERAGLAPAAGVEATPTSTTDRWDLGLESEDTGERPARILYLLVEHCGARGGYLFGLAPRAQLRELARAAEPAAVTPELLAEAQTYLQAELSATADVTMTMADRQTLTGGAATFVGGGHAYYPVPMLTDGEGESLVAGLALLRVEGATPQPPDALFVGELARVLLGLPEIEPAAAAQS